MKRLAIWIFLGLVVVSVASRRESRARDDSHRSRSDAKTTQVVVYNQSPDQDRDDDGTTIIITRGHQRQREFVQPVPPVPPQPPMPPRPPAKAKKAPRPPKAPSVAEHDRPTPDWFPKNHDEEVEAIKTSSNGHRIVIGPISASPTEAKAALNSRLRKEVFEWLAPEMETIWEPTDSELSSLVIKSHVQPVLFDLDRMGVGSGVTLGAAGVAPTTENLYTIYKAGEIVDFSESARHRLVKQYQHRIVRDRMLKGGGILAFALVCLATLTGYIRADEATKGYYTKRLRLVATAGVGAAGFALYRWLV